MRELRQALAISAVESLLDAYRADMRALSVKVQRQAKEGLVRQEFADRISAYVMKALAEDGEGQALQ